PSACFDENVHARSWVPSDKFLIVGGGSPTKKGIVILSAAKNLCTPRRVPPSFAQDGYCVTVA
ncbi:MAG TPA: hypothetical protein VGN39_19015, partial [Terriglobales bacterium]|nr:hypothetical protein [Terriglobales bacterium]